MLRQLPLDSPWTADWHDLRWLQGHRSYPSVTVLAETAPTEHGLGADDRRRLDLLIDSAERRLLPDVGAEVTATVAATLRRLADDASQRRPGRSLALFASPFASLAIPLSVEVRERVVVDETFATRDVVHHLRRAVGFKVVTVSGRSCALFAGTIDSLREVVHDPFPMRRGADESDGLWIRRMAAAIRDATTGGTSAEPLVLAGVERTVADVRHHSGVQPAGIVPGSVSRRSWQELHEQAWPVVEAWLAERELDAFGRLDRARGARRFAAGIDELWSLAQDGRIGFLAAERDFEYPARVDGDRLAPADDREAPDVVDDAVDELIEIVLARGGSAMVVSPGSLRDEGGVAAELRY